MDNHDKDAIGGEQDFTYRVMTGGLLAGRSARVSRRLPRRPKK
jgi:hypothetical protein